MGVSDSCILPASSQDHLILWIVFCRISLRLCSQCLAQTCSTWLLLLFMALQCSGVGQWWDSVACMPSSEIWDITNSPNKGGNRYSSLEILCRHLRNTCLLLRSQWDWTAMDSPVSNLITDFYVDSSYFPVYFYWYLNHAP